MNFRPAAPDFTKKKEYVPKPKLIEKKELITRPPAVYTNVSYNERIDQVLNTKL